LNEEANGGQTKTQIKIADKDLKKI